MGTKSRSAAVLALATMMAGALTTGTASAAPVGSWLTARGNDARTGRAANETVITKSSIGHLAPIWSAPSQSVEGTEAIVSGGSVYVVTTDSKLRRLNGTNGNTVWTSGIAGVPETPTLDGGTVYVLGGSRVRAVNAATGATKFNVPVEYFCGDGSGCFGGLGTANGKVVVGAGGLLHILNGTTGALLSTTDVSQGDFDSNGGGTPAIDANGAAWSSYKFVQTAPVPPSSANPVPTPKISGNGFATPLIVGGKVYVTSKSQGITSFAVTTGAKTNFLPGAIGQHQALATDGTRLFDVTIEAGVKTLTAYNRSTGAVLWSRNGAVTAPLSVNGMVVVGENYGGLAVYDAASGALLKRLAGTARGADPIVVGGRVYAGYSPTSVPPGTNPPLTALGV
jgi:outer membrane protein assembly factor BamB